MKKRRKQGYRGEHAWIIIKQLKKPIVRVLYRLEQESNNNIKQANNIPQ